MQWKLTLYHDAKTMAPARYELRCDYGLTVPGKPGVARHIRTLERQGVWTKTKSSNGAPGTAVIELRGSLSLLQVGHNILHVLNRDGSLMAGNGGWSFSLNRSEAAERPVDPALARSEPDMSYRISPLAAGPAVFGVFEGRTPCIGIAHRLEIPVHPACLKAKWRVTLYQDPETLAPKRYRIEGTLYRRGALEGNWGRIEGIPGNPQAAVYRLMRAGGSPALYLLKGDDNVLFFVNQHGQPLVGNADFSYTLDRRIAARRPS
jgi:hypothetical protein